MSPAGRDRESGAEARLAAYLEEMTANPPRSDTALVKRVTHRARWQRAVRDPLRVAGLIAAALFDGIAGIFGPGRGARR